jgi:hypothetical protein
MERKLLQVEEEGARRILQRRQKGEGEAEEITEDTIEGSSLLNYGQVCYRCMLITADPAHCPTCGQPPLTKRPEPEITFGSENVDKPQKQQPSNPSSEPVRKPEAGNTVNNASEVVDLSEAEELVAANPKKWEKVLEKAVQKSDEKTATMLADLSLEEIALFITEFLRYKTNGELTQNILGLVKLGVVKPVTRAKRVMPSKTGKILLEAYKEVFGNE